MPCVEKASDILARLVGFDTTSHKSNKPLIAWVKDYLKGHGVQAMLLDDDTGQKQNLIAIIGDPSAQGIVLSGHTDVVPADGQIWTSDPFTLRRDGGKLFGRGTTDMKAFLSAALAAVPEMVARDLSRPITLAFTHDEEVGCLGAPALVAKLNPGQQVIVGEPTRLAPGLRHKGARVQTLTLRGVPAHSGTPELGVNAVTPAAHALAALEDLAQHLSQGAGAYQSTLVVSKIAGGSAINIVPETCTITWMLRAVSSGDLAFADKRLSDLANDLDAVLKAQDPSAGARLETLADVPPFGRGPLDATFGSVTKGRPPVDLTFGTEAGIFGAAGHDVIVCGPGDMAQGHTVDEFITLQDFADGCRFIEDVIETCA
jgi:acetylornithine deacetylase